MAWYNEAIFYHIYPLGLTGAPKQNSYTEPVHRLRNIFSWIPHIREIGCNAIYIGPLFESVGHGYETTDYKKLDSRLGTNEDLTDFVTECHKNGIRVILDGVFNHTGRDFFAFKDIKQNRENSQYKDWYCNVNFWGNNSFNDGFSYENWGGHDLLVKLNQHNPAVKDYICDVIRFWVREFDIDGIRLDAADVMDFNYMQSLRHVANEVKEDFWLMGEVIHGDYSKWANEGTLHSVTNYMLHKALFSGHNDHNYFEIAHTIKYVNNMSGNRLQLYTFVDNHDVERIYTKLKNKAHFAPVHIMLYTLPGIPSVYYGSEFGIEGKKEQFSDDSLRPALNYQDYKDAVTVNSFTKLIAALGRIRQNTPALAYGEYHELELRNTYFAYERVLDGKSVIITVNNADQEASINLPGGSSTEYIGALSGKHVSCSGGRIQVSVASNDGEIWIPVELYQSREEADIKTDVEILKPSSLDKVLAESQNNINAQNNSESVKTEMRNDTVAANGTEQKPGIFKDKVVVITGAVKGIGKCIREEFEKEGARVCYIDVLDNPYYVGNIGNEYDLRSFAAKVIGEHGKVDYLINNAPPLFKGIERCSYDEFNYALRVGISSAFLLTQLFLPYFTSDSCIINISSSRDRMSQPQSESYAAAKGGISSLTHALAVSLGGKVRVNSISPGWINTEEKVYEGSDATQQPAGRVGRPLDIANMVLFLCSDKAGFITGENICIDGGQTKLMIYHDDFGWSFNP